MNGDYIKYTLVGSFGMLPAVASIPIEILQYQQPPDNGIPFVVAHVDPATSNIIYDRTSITRALALALIILLGLISVGVLTIIMVYIVNWWKMKHSKPSPILKVTPAQSIHKRQSQVKQLHTFPCPQLPRSDGDEGEMAAYLVPPEPTLTFDRNSKVIRQT